MAKNDDSGCSTVLTFVGLGFVLFLLYRIVQFFQRPDALKSVIEFVGALGACAGVAVLAVVSVIILAQITNRPSSPAAIATSKHYRMRCQATDMAQTTPDADQANSSDDLVQATVEPIYVLFSLTNYGPGLEVASMPAAWLGTTADNARRFSRLSGNRLDSIILPWGCFHLYYGLYSQVGDRSLELTPPNEAVYTGLLPALPAGQQVKIVIVYTGILAKENLGHIITLGQPLKLTLVALDEQGCDAPGVTCELYDVVFKSMNPPDSDEDDSWMYRSRPIWW
jgi:hypothetical protein